MYKRLETCWKFTPLNEDRHLAMLGEADVILHLGYKNCRSKTFPSKNICLAGGETRDHHTLWIDIAFRESVNKIPWHVLLRPPSWSGFVALPFDQEGLRARGPFLDSPVNFSGPKSNIQIQIKRIRARVLASKLLPFVSLTDIFIMLDAKLLKLRSLM